MLYTELLYAVVPTLFSYFLLFYYPYIFRYGGVARTKESPQAPYGHAPPLRLQSS